MDKRLSAVVTRNLSKTVRRYANGAKTTQPTEGMATFVRRDSDGTCWVRLPGATADTPANGGILASAEPGQTVSYRIDGTRLTVTGNASDPAVGVGSVSSAIAESSESLSSTIRTGITKVFEDITGDIIAIINAAVGGGTIDTSKLNLTGYYTSTQTNSRISSELAGAFNWADSTSKIRQFIDWYKTNVLAPAINAIDVGGANLLNNSGWSSASDVAHTSTITTGRWRLDGLASLSYSGGLLVVATSASSGSYGMCQRVEVEPSTKYVISAEVGSPYHISIGSDATTRDSTGWVADGKRIWKTYTTGASQTYAYVTAWATNGSPCKLNRIMLEKATVSSDWSPSTTDVDGEIAEAYGTAEQAVNALAALPKTESGSVGQTETVPANGYRDYSVTFDSAFSSAPNVTLTIYTTSTATTFDCDIYLRSVSTTGFTARIFNRENTSRSPGFRWQAS